MRPTEETAGIVLVIIGVIAWMIAYALGMRTGLFLLMVAIFVPTICGIAFAMWYEKKHPEEFLKWRK